MDSGTATTMLTILGTSFGVIVASLITLMVASIRIQHRDSTETRRLIAEASKENRDLIDQARKENRDLIDKNRDLIERSNRALISMLGDARERLARIEGHLRIGRPAADDPESDGDSREAA